MPTFQTIQQEADNRNLIRKIQRAVAFLAPTSVELPTTLFEAGGTLVDLKAAGWLPFGLVTPDGYEFGRDVSKEDVSALGYASPVRSDVTEVARSVKMTALETGRKHQIRLQLAERGCPILGDLKYGSRDQFSSGIALHARRLTLAHPVQGAAVELTAPLPKAWRGFDLPSAQDP